MSRTSTAVKVACRVGAVVLSLAGAFFGLATVVALLDGTVSAAVILAVGTALSFLAAVRIARLPGRRSAAEAGGPLGSLGRVGDARRRRRTQARVAGGVMALVGAVFGFAAIGMFLKSSYFVGGVFTLLAAIILQRAWLSAFSRDRRSPGGGWGGGSGGCGGGGGGCGSGCGSGGCGGGGGGGCGGGGG